VKLWAVSRVGAVTDASGEEVSWAGDPDAWASEGSAEGDSTAAELSGTVVPGSLLPSSTMGFTMVNTIITAATMRATDRSVVMIRKGPQPPP
jgi:hypothetical protein